METPRTSAVPYHPQHDCNVFPLRKTFLLEFRRGTPEQVEIHLFFLSSRRSEMRPQREAIWQFARAWTPEPYDIGQHVFMGSVSRTSPCHAKNFRIMTGSSESEGDFSAERRREIEENEIFTTGRWRGVAQVFLWSWLAVCRRSFWKARILTEKVVLNARVKSSF